MHIVENGVERETPADWMLVVMTALTVTLYLASNLMSLRIVDWGWLSMDAGTLVFPCVFMLENIMTEIWGFRMVRRVIFLVFACNLLMISATSMVVLLPAPVFQQEFTVAAYRHVFLNVPRLIAASLIAFLVGGLCNAWAMARIRQMTEGRHLWMRTIGSSVLGFFLDSFLFSFIAFSFTVPWCALACIVMVQFAIKIAMEILFSTPVAYGVIGFMKKRYFVMAGQKK